MSVPVHRCRFMDYERPGVSAMAFNAHSVGPKGQSPPELRLAVGRSNGDIEIWNPYELFCETVVPGARGRSVEDLCWIRTDGKYRLFSVGGTDTIVEWDLASGLPHEFARSDAGVVWAMAASPDETQLAVATETGNVVVFDVGNGGIEFRKRLSGADASSLASLTWVSQTTIAAGGSDGTVRIWDVEQSRIVATMRVDKQKVRAKPGSGSSASAEEDTVVWAVLALPRTNQLVSGDSNGYVKVWDTKTWSLQQSLQAHEGDVLSLAVNWNGTSLFSSGLDQKIVNTRLTDAKIRRWTVMNSSVAHTHDIRCMASYEAGKLSLLVSAGLEPGFVISDTQNFVTAQHRKVAATRFKPQAEITGNYVTEWREQTAAIWQIGSGDATSSEAGAEIGAGVESSSEEASNGALNGSPNGGPGSGRRLRAKVKISGEEYLTSASFDPELGLLALGTLYSLRLFLIDGSEVSPVPLKNWDAETGAKLLKWAEPEKLVVVTDSDACVVYDTDSDSITRINAGNNDQDDDNDDDTDNSGSAIRTVPARLPYTNRVALLAVCDGLVALARHSRLIDIYTVTGKHVSSLPLLPAEVMALAFRGARNLVVATADRAVIEFDTVSGQLTPWSRLNQGRMPPQLANAAEPAYGIFGGIGKAERVWLWGPSWLATIDFSSTKPLRKRRSADEEDNEDDEVDVAVVEDTANADDLPAFWMSHKYKPLFFAGALGTGLLVSERPDQSIGAKRFWSNRRIQI